MHMFVTLKKVYDRNVVNEYGLYLLLGVIIYSLIDYVYIYIYIISLLKHHTTTHLHRLNCILDHCSYVHGLALLLLC